MIGAPWASHLIVTARTSGDRRDKDGISVFIVEKDASGITTRDYPTVDGRRAPASRAAFSLFCRGRRGSSSSSSELGSSSSSELGCPALAAAAAA